MIAKMIYHKFWQEALRKSHNSAARALLRAGFGPAPVGTFALEGQPKPEDGDAMRRIWSPGISSFKTFWHL